MSALAQELAKHINKLKHLATNLSTEVADLETDVPTDAMGGEGWTLSQRDELWATIADHAETCNEPSGRPWTTLMTSGDHSSIHSDPREDGDLTWAPRQ